MAINAWSKCVLHDNTRPYKEMVTEEIGTYLVCSVHTLDLPDIAPTDYYFFSFATKRYDRTVFLLWELKNLNKNIFTSAVW